MSVQLHVPEGSFGEVDGDTLAGMLRFLTRELVVEYWQEPTRGFLGGEFGYGVPFASASFVMHPFCWCESDDCPWCVGCNCPASAFHYFCDGVEVEGWEPYQAFFTSVAGKMPHEVHQHGSPEFEAYSKRWNTLAKEANDRRTMRHDPECDYCLTGGVASLIGGGPAQGAPNFWHFQSGLKVWWYKYIGRGMEVEGPDAPTWGPGRILNDCLASLGTKS